jgi:hypothetical protein
MIVNVIINQQIPKYENLQTHTDSYSYSHMHSGFFPGTKSIIFQIRTEEN